MVNAASRHERLVIAAFDDRRVLHDEDDVRAPDRLEMVSDDETRPTLHQPFKALEDGLFGCGVKPGRGFIEDQDRCVPNEGAGDGDSMPLSTRQCRAALAD